jgi:hypothetical protein
VIYLDTQTAIVATASTLTAVGVIWGIVKFWSRKMAKKVGIVAANAIQEKDIHPESYLGKALAWNEKTDDRLLAIEKQLRANEIQMKSNDLSTKRLELLTMIHITPEAVRLIENVYQEYKKIGGNSYICNDIVPAWRKKYAENIVKNEI